MDPDTNQPDLEETSGLEDLRSALGGGAPWEEETTPDSPSTPETPVSDSGNTVESEGDEPQELSDDDVAKVLSNARVQAQLKAQYEQGFKQAAPALVARAREIWEQEQLRQRQEEDEALLDDEEIGKRLRQQKELEPIVRRAQAAGMAQAQQDFFQNAVGSVWNVVPELQNLPDNAKQNLHPLNPNFRTYGDYINAIIDVAAEQRAAKKAESLVEAAKASELSRIRKNSPSPAGPSGPASGPGPIIDVERMSGDALLKAAFR
jgi:hypothetical protein